MNRIKKNKLRYLIIFIILAFLSCSKQQAEIPNEILVNIWIPTNAQDINRYIIGGTYQISYSIKICFPPKEAINDMVSKMSDRGWQRLDYDFLNPGLKLHHRRGVSGMWGHFKERNSKDTYQWIEDWEDSSKNIVRYILKYKAKKNKEDLLKICDLKVTAIYTPKELAEQIREESRIGIDKLNEDK